MQDMIRAAKMAGSYKDDIGKKTLSRDNSISGVVTGIVNRYCAGCGCVGPVYSVKWEDGKRTFPCPAGCHVKDGIIHIL